MKDRKAWNSTLRPVAKGKKKAARAARKTPPRRGKEVIARLLGEGRVHRADSLALLDNELLVLFNRSVRRLALDRDGMVTCYICHRKVPYEQSEAMHFQGRAARGTRFNRLAVKAGCHDCNAKPLGDREAFARRIDQEHGPGTAEELTRLSKRVMRFDREWYRQRIEECIRINQKKRP